MSCWNCNEDGMVVVCVDDLCRAAGHCMHGDGEVLCDVCGGEDLPDEDDTLGEIVP